MPLFVIGVAALELGWIEPGPLGWVLLMGFGLMGAAAQIAFGLVSAVADLLAGRRD